MSNSKTNGNSNRTDNNSKNNTNNNNDKIVDDKDMFAENLRKNGEQRKKDSKFFNMQPGDKVVLKFLPEFGPKWRDFDDDGVDETLRYEYNVIDLNHPDEGPKVWGVSKTWSQDIDYHLANGNTILKAERVGAGRKTTRYHFTPASAPSGAANTGAATS